MVCFYTCSFKNLHPRLKAINLIFKLLKKTWDFLGKTNRTFHHIVVRRKEKSAEQCLIKWKKYILIKIKTITSHESFIHMPPFRLVHFRRPCSTKGTFLSTLVSLIIILMFLFLFLLFFCCIISEKTWTTNQHVYLIHSPLVLRFGITPQLSGGSWMSVRLYLRSLISLLVTFNCWGSCFHSLISTF